MHTLLIEDTIPLAQTLIRYLTNEGIHCVLRTDGLSGYTEAMQGNYDVIILDIALPKMDGIELCRKLRAEGRTTPIIMLTSRSTQDDIILGLDCGADDYMKKPCDYRELIARIKALSRREQSNKSSDIIDIGPLSIDPANQIVHYQDREIHLAKREYELLLYFATHEGHTVTKTELLEKVWGIYDSWEEGKVVEVYIGYLRKKIPGIIVTRKGHGYILNDT